MQILLRTETPPPQEAEQLLHVSQRDQVGQFCVNEQFNQEEYARILVSAFRFATKKNRKFFGTFGNCFIAL